jgi:hypothetical protein
MTVDLRVQTASTKPTAWPKPNLQDEFHDLHGSEVFATLDFCQGYWQIPLHKDSQDSQFFITPNGVCSAAWTNLIVIVMLTIIVVC